MIKAGILGGGQLGRMLLQAAVNYPVTTFVMESDEQCPAAHLCHHFTKGDITCFEDVYQFGRELDVLTIEIENVNVEALVRLQQEGVRIYPDPAALTIIKNKILQKNFYKAHGIPTSEFVITDNQADLKNRSAFLPAVHKLAEGGYDGKGVVSINTPADVVKGFNKAAVLEKKVSIKSELAVIIAVAESGDTAIYPPVDMVFDPQLNLLSHQLSPADVAQEIIWKAEAIALRVVKELKSPGIFAVELFADEAGNVLVNETAPRVHNSGHHTIEANYSSQFDMLWRVLLQYPLGNPDAILPAAIVNLIGEKDHSGTARYDGLKEVLAMDNVFVHLYGKKETRPGRKMGHITILSKEKQELIHKANQIKQLLFVRAE